MLGRGVLRECLLATDVDAVLVVGRNPVGEQHAKLREILHHDFLDFSGIEGELAGYQACFYCLGTSSVGVREPEYRRITYDFTLALAGVLARLSPGLTFGFVSGQGTDSSGQGRVMWARVKGQTENALLELPLQAYMFRPGFIQPLHGASPSNQFYRAFYRAVGPLVPLLQRLFPKQVTTTERLGRAMLQVTRSGAPKRVLATADINALSGGGMDP